MTEYIEEVTKIVEWYKELPKDYGNIEDLIYARQKLSTYQFLMAVELGKLRQVWKEAEVGTEIVRRQKAVECIAENMPMTKVQELSKAEALLMLEAEKIADVSYHNMKFMIDQTAEVNNSMMQHISHLKTEKSNIRSHT
jgi:hypothetical protein